MAGSTLPPINPATAAIVKRLGEEMAAAGDPQIAAHTRIGQVTAVDTGTVTATVAYGAGANLVAIAGHRWLVGHEPAVNDYVQILSQDGINWIVGKIATTMTASVLPSVSLRKSSAASISNNTWTSLTMNVEEWDLPGGMHDTGANTELITIVTAGRYRFTGGFTWGSHATGRRIAAFWIDVGSGLVERVRDERYPVQGGTGTSHHLSKAYDLAAGNSVALRCFQTSGGGLAVDEANEYTQAFFQAEWVP